MLSTLYYEYKYKYKYKHEGNKTKIERVVGRAGSVYATGQRDLFEAINLTQNDGYLSNSVPAILPLKTTNIAPLYYEVQDSVLSTFARVRTLYYLFHVLSYFLKLLFLFLFWFTSQITIAISLLTIIPLFYLTLIFESFIFVVQDHSVEEQERIINLENVSNVDQLITKN